MYDFLVVGAGLAGAVLAHELNKKGYKVIVVEKRENIGGNCMTSDFNGITIHEYGPHIFHTKRKEIWDYINQFAEFNNFINSPIANYKGKLYNLPFNMNTFYSLYGVKTPYEAKERIKQSIGKSTGNIKNLKDKAISMVGEDIFKILIEGYTEKQWGRPCTDLPSDIIKRLPLRFTYDNNYFNDNYQGIPIGGYSQIFEKLLDGILILTNYAFAGKDDCLTNIAKHIIYTGPIDEYYNFCFGRLEYRATSIIHTLYDVNDVQGVAVMNYTSKDVPFMRTIEHKHFDNSNHVEGYSIVSYEYSEEYVPGKEPSYPINTLRNNLLYLKYKELADKQDKVIFTGRLGKYKYQNMDEVILDSLNIANKFWCLQIKNDVV